jgi:hypothetical protein
MERKIQRSALVVDVDHYYPSNGSKQVRSESYEPAYDASSSRRLVTRESLVLAVNPLTPDSGRSRVPALTSRTSAIS